MNLDMRAVMMNNEPDDISYNKSQHSVLSPVKVECDLSLSTMHYNAAECSAAELLHTSDALCCMPLYGYTYSCYWDVCCCNVMHSPLCELMPP